MGLGLRGLEQLSTRMFGEGSVLLEDLLRTVEGEERVLEDGADLVALAGVEVECDGVLAWVGCGLEWQVLPAMHAGLGVFAGDDAVVEAELGGFGGACGGGGFGLSVRPGAA